jgi:predicted chitinase
MRISDIIDPVDDSHLDLDLEEGWKDWVAGAALGAAALAPQTADAKSAPQERPAVTKQVSSAAATPAEKEAATRLILKPEAKVLIQTARASGMRGSELAQFIAQCAHETANFSSLKEKGGKLDFKKYDPKHNPRKAKMLGNTQVGDGAKFHGRGYIQLTGRDNYKRAGKALGLPLEAQPELVENPEVAAKVAVWFWQQQVAPKVTNFSNTAQVTKPINSGLKGLEDRHIKYAGILSLMAPKS